MIKIAHRGNTNGPIPELENNPGYLISAIEQGFDVEVDVWWYKNAIYFGHDFPQYLISPHDFYKIRDNAWFHCKHLNSLQHFLDNHPTSKFFWHQHDDFTLTSNGYIWTYPLMPTLGKSILVDLNLSNNQIGFPPAGICTDYPNLIQ